MNLSKSGKIDNFPCQGIRIQSPCGGIEEKEASDIVKEYQCDFVQGFYFLDQSKQKIPYLGMKKIEKVLRDSFTIPPFKKRATF